MITLTHINNATIPFSIIGKSSIPNNNFRPMTTSISKIYIKNSPIKYLNIKTETKTVKKINHNY